MLLYSSDYIKIIQFIESKIPKVINYNNILTIYYSSLRSIQHLNCLFINYISSI